MTRAISATAASLLRFLRHIRVREIRQSIAPEVVVEPGEVVLHDRRHRPRFRVTMAYLYRDRPATCMSLGGCRPDFWKLVAEVEANAEKPSASE